MHPLDLLANYLMCCSYLALWGLYFALRSFKSASNYPSSAGIAKRAVVLSAVAILFNPAVFNFMGGQFLVIFFLLPLIPAIATALQSRTSTDKLPAAVATFVALYFVECARVTLMAQIYPPNLFS